MCPVHAVQKLLRVQRRQRKGQMCFVTPAAFTINAFTRSYCVATRKPRALTELSNVVRMSSAEAQLASWSSRVARSRTS